jgi:hypothetical protein
MRTRARKGARLRIPAGDWNAAMEAAEILSGGKLNRRDNTLSVPRFNGDVLVKNMTGSTLDQFAIVGLDDELSPNTDAANLGEFKQQNFQFDGVVATKPGHFGKWGVVQETIEDESVGRVRISGITIAKVLGDKPDDAMPWFAECDGIVANLKRRHRGSAQILWYDDATDWAVIRICNAQRPNLVLATLTNGNTFDQATKSDPHTANVSSGIDSLWTGSAAIEVANPLSLKLWTGRVILAGWDYSGDRWVVLNAYGGKVIHRVRRGGTSNLELQQLDGVDGWTKWADLGPCSS